MDDPLKKQDIENMWYENDKPVLEYLQNECAKRSKTKADGIRAEKFSWLKMMRKSRTGR
jgi:hypothetical protein